MIYSSQNISYSNLMMVLLDLVVIIKMYIYRGISIQKKNHIAAISLCKWYDSSRYYLCAILETNCFKL